MWGRAQFDKQAIGCIIAAKAATEKSTRARARRERGSLTASPLGSSAQKFAPEPTTETDGVSSK